MAAIVPVGYQNLGNGVWGTDITIKGKAFQVVVNPTTEQKWIYEKDTFGNGKPLFTILPSGDPTSKGDKFSYHERRSALDAAGIGPGLLYDTLKQQTTWSNVKGTLPAPPGRSGIGTSPDNTNNQNPDNSDPASSPAVFDISSNNFQNDEEFSNKDWLKYPKDMNLSQDRIVITQRRYIATNAFSEGKINENAISQERFKEPPTKEQLLGTVILPMPNDISETNVTAWGEDSLSSLAALVGGAALGVAGGLGAGNFDKIGKAANEAIKTTLNKESGANETIKQLLTLNAASAVTKKFGININPEAFRSRITGTAINPNLELLFQGPKLRSFAFQFKMSPRSWEEARNIRYIIKFFKKGMAAKRNFTDAKAAYFLGTPNVFDINFKSGNTELGSIGKIKTCALQQCTVNYTPDGFYAAYEDTQKNAAGGSQPIAVTITLAFTELTPLYNDNYEDSDTVGWDVLNDGPTGTPSTSSPAPSPSPSPTGQPTAAQQREAGEALIKSGAGASPAQTLIKSAS